MSERKLYSKFKEKITKADPNCWAYKIPDTFNLGGKKPGDFFLVVKGVPFLLEFKSKGGSMTLYQSYQLTDFNNAGGEALEYKEGEETLDEFVEKIIGIVRERKVLTK